MLNNAKIVLGIVLLATWVGAHPLLDAGDRLFARRAEGAVGDKADRSIVLASVGLYRQATQISGLERDASVRLMRALYFQGCFTYVDDADRLATFAEAKNVGEKILKLYPRDPELAYWWAVNLGLWAKEIGPFEAIRKGAADQVRRTIGQFVAGTPNKDHAGAYQILGRMHHLLPRVPFLLSWPDRSKAGEYLRMAVTLEPENLQSRLFLAEFLRDQGQEAEAQTQLAILVELAKPLERDPEGSRVLWKAKEILATLSPKEQVATGLDE